MTDPFRDVKLEVGDWILICGMLVISEEKSRKWDDPKSLTAFTRIRKTIEEQILIRGKT